MQRIITFLNTNRVEDKTQYAPTSIFDYANLKLQI